MSLPCMSKHSLIIAVPTNSFTDITCLFYGNILSRRFHKNSLTGKQVVGKTLLRISTSTCTRSTNPTWNNTFNVYIGDCISTGITRQRRKPLITLFVNITSTTHDHSTYRDWAADERPGNYYEMLCRYFHSPLAGGLIPASHNRTPTCKTW